jgi:pimeloyl-ACP methyl ester carboxylesterase
MLRKLALVLGLLLVVVALLGIRFDLPAAEVDATYRTPHSHWTTLADGTRLHYWDRGNPQGKPLVLLHGSYDCADTWELWAPLLERDFRLIVPDLPAHGLTGQTAANDYSIDAMVRAVHSLLQRLALDKVSLAGNSMGGNTSWRFALAHPDKVERLVLVDAAGYPMKDPVSPRTGNAFSRLLLRYGNPGLLLRRGFADAVEDDSIVTDARVERWTAYVRRAGSRPAHMKRAEQRNFAGQPFARIPEIRQPTLILWGDRDQLIPVANAHRFARDLPDAQLIVYPGIGHMPQLEIPERSANATRSFLLASQAPAAAHPSAAK